ncbi:hypothetical protein [Pseudostreptobacillus sp.]
MIISYSCPIDNKSYTTGMKDYKQWVNSKIPKVNRTIIQVHKDRHLDKQNYKKLKKVLKNQDYYLIYKLNTVK